MSDERAIRDLIDLLEPEFSREQWTDFLRHLPILSEAPGGSEPSSDQGSNREFFERSVRRLDALGVLGAPEFWSHLEAARPTLMDGIRRLRDQFLAKTIVEPAPRPQPSSIEQMFLWIGSGLIVSRLHNALRLHGWIALRVRAEPCLSVHAVVAAYHSLYQDQYQRLVRLDCDQAQLPGQILAYLGPPGGARRRYLFVWEPVSMDSAFGELPQGFYDLIVLGPHRLNWVRDLEIVFTTVQLSEACGRLYSRFSEPERARLDWVLRETGQHPVLLVAMEEILRRITPSDLLANAGPGLDLGPLGLRSEPGCGRSAYAVLRVLSELRRPGPRAQPVDAGGARRINTRAIRERLAAMVPLARAPLEGLRGVFEDDTRRVEGWVLRVAAVACPGFAIPPQLLYTLTCALASAEADRAVVPSRQEVHDACFHLRESGLLGWRQDHAIVVTAHEQALIILSIGVGEHQRDHGLCGEELRRLGGVLPSGNPRWAEKGVSIAAEAVHLMHWLWSSHGVAQLGGGRMCTLDPGDLDLLARSVRLLSKAGAWEAAASLATELQEGLWPAHGVPGASRVEIVSVLVGFGRHARRSGRPLAGRSPASWCALALALVEAPEQGTQISAEVRNAVIYEAAITLLEETSDPEQADEATATLEALQTEYPVVDGRTAVRRAHHLSRVARAHQRRAELAESPKAARAAALLAVRWHDHAETLLRLIGWTASADYCVLLQRRALTMRALAWVQFNLTGVWPHEAMTSALTLLQRALGVLQELSGVVMRDERHIHRYIVLSLIDCGMFEEAIAKAEALVEEEEGSEAGGGTMHATWVTAQMAQAVHARCVRRLVLDAVQIPEPPEPDARPHADGPGAMARVALQFDVVVIRLMRSSDAMLSSGHDEIEDVLRSKLESIRRVAGPNSPETLLRSSILRTVVDWLGTQFPITGDDHES